MRFQELDAEWDDDNVDHIAAHGVEPEEVEEIVYEDCHPSWIVRGRRRRIREVRWTVYGQTCSGRYLIAVIAPIPEARSLARGNSEGDGTMYSTEVSAMARKLSAAKRRALREEADEWDQLSDEDFERSFDDGEPVHIRLRRPPPKTLTVSLDTQTLNRLRRVARRKQVGPRQLAAIWIAERLGEEPAATSGQRRTG